VGRTPGKATTVKTRTCTTGESRKRLSAARKFLEAAELFLGDVDPEGRRVAVSNAVLAGIAAADAMCCARLGKHAVGDDHRTAADLVRGIGPGGAEASKALIALLGIKHKAQYQASPVGRGDAKAAVRRARALVTTAERIVFSST
jgi:hypothetical protein